MTQKCNKMRHAFFLLRSNKEVTVLFLDSANGESPIEIIG